MKKITITLHANDAEVESIKAQALALAAGAEIVDETDILTTAELEALLAAAQTPPTPPDETE